MDLHLCAYALAGPACVHAFRMRDTRTRELLGRVACASHEETRAMRILIDYYIRPD
jgi:hypothetical protein